MPKRKLHEFINNIEHKHCCRCYQWKVLDQFGKDTRARDGKYVYCKACVNKKEKQRDTKTLEKREKARKAAPTGFLVCLRTWCTVKGLQPMDQFTHSHVRNDKTTKLCLTCRNKAKEAKNQRYAPCQKVWDDWRKKHPCVICIKDPNYKHKYLVIEADHLGGKVKDCSRMTYWCHSQRGPDALRSELMKCQALCVFHHALQTQQRNHDNGRIQTNPCVLRKRAIINAEKHKRGCCLRCKRVLKEGEECTFHFDHRDPTTKFKRNGKAIAPSFFANLSQALFDSQWPLEQAKCDLLCANCHRLKDNRDGYKT